MAANKGLDHDLIARVYQETGNATETARRVKCSRGTVGYVIRRKGLDKPVASGKKAGAVKEVRASLPSRGVKRYILTCAQNNTHVHEEFFANLQALARYYDAALMVSRITYNVNAYTVQAPKPGKNNRDALFEGLWYDPALEPYHSDQRVELAPGLVWCGEVNILPTAEKPLRGFETYTGRRSGIFPHTKIAMESIASGKHEPTKFNYTTGACTLMSYIQRKAGQKAEHHHAYGALVVEVDHEGRWFVRQINATRDGSFYDLTLRVHRGEVTDGHGVEAINWGDIHEEEGDPVVRQLAFGEGGMLDTLRPRYQFFNDTVSFRRRNHWDRGDPHVMFEKHVLGQEAVEAEIQSAARFLAQESARSWCTTVVVDSNHDNAMERWLRETDYRGDHVNARYFLRCQLRKYDAIFEQDKDFHLIEWALREAGVPKGVRFLREDESFVICRDAGGGIECGMHGHYGPDGSRGSPSGLSRMGRRANTGHTHKAGIIDGLYTAGTSSLLDLRYNKGPSSWSHSHIVTYKNGKRAIVTMWKGAWRAG